MLSEAFMKIEEHDYYFTRGSDVIRDGMFLEVSRDAESGTELVAEVFFSDITLNYTLTCFMEDVPLELIEELIRQAKIRLPPVNESNG
ncbi:hypothetical protein EM595_2080 [Duffyella gerundensis]|uniref:Uncharacterized protein n=2 Tax=Duffyella gerundensis TaxID=1619313 RepID=A0A0U5L0T1_9GAMM|nr:hypothetical protein EM595_2080 [Duffyella gerundensis]